jgi:phosphate uptake regulator
MVQEVFLRMPMEIRKVQVTGGSSFVITLPKEWVKSLNIQKNDPVGLIAQPDGTLLVTPRTREKIHRTKKFQVDTIKDSTYLFRLLVGAYIMGYSSIVLKSEKRLPPFVMEVVTTFTQTAIGPEIIEETMDSITIKDLLNPSEMPFEKTVRRMYIILKKMHEDAIDALKTRNKKMAMDVISRDNSVNRLQWLVARQSNVVLRDIILAKKMEVTQEVATYYFLVSRIMERIGDHAARIAENVLFLIDQQVDESIIDPMVKASELSQRIFSNSMKAWTKKDIRTANQSIEEIDELVLLCEEINNSALNIKGESSIPVSYIAESIKRIGEYATDIAELVINRLVSE